MLLREASLITSALLFAAGTPLQSTPTCVELRSHSRRLRAADEVYALTIVDHLAAMDANWDGYGALKINERTARNAKTALSLMLSYIGSPDIIPNANGTLSFEWTSPRGEAHLEIGMNRFSAYVKAIGNPAVPIEGQATAVPAALAEIIADALFPRFSTIAPITSLRLTADHERATG